MRGSHWILIGSIAGGTGVAFGAFAAHGLSGILTPELLQIFHTGALYQMFHALALLGLGAWTARAEQTPAARTPARVAGWAITLGIPLFSGSLYALALTGARGLGAITPFGGLAFLVGWSALGFAAWREHRPESSSS